MAFPRRLHDPDAVLDYPVDWSDWLTGGDTIVSAEVFPPTGITVGSVDVHPTVVIAWLSGGVPSVSGTKYDVRYHIVTAQGREDDRTITLVVKER
jgi:hypothetical protein